MIKSPTINQESTNNENWSPEDYSFQEMTAFHSRFDEFGVKGVRWIKSAIKGRFSITVADVRAEEVKTSNYVPH